jgi:cell division protein FtsN
MLGGKQTKPADMPPASKAEEPAVPAVADSPKTKKQLAEEVKAAAAKAEAAAKPPAEAAVDPKGKVYSSDPLGDLAQTKAGGKSVSTAKAPSESAATSSAEPFSFFVQVGAFRTPEDAQAQRAKLAMMGLDAKVSEREQSGRTVYRVRLGPYDRLSDAEKMKEDLQPSGLETALVRVQR